MIHPTSDIQSEKIGNGTRIWQYVVVLPGATIGANCNICSHCFIENDVVIGDRVTIKCGVHIWCGIALEDDVFVGPNVAFSNDPFPRSQKHPAQYSRTIVKRGASIGANATILPGITIGADAMVGAGSVVTSNVPPGAVVVGNPAAIVRYTNVKTSKTSTAIQSKAVGESLTIDGVKWLELTCASDSRGQLTVAQWDQHLPFMPQRVFFVHHVPSRKVRGEHAHRQCDQVLVALTGSVKVVVDDAVRRQELVLNDSRLALLIPAGIWATQYAYSEDCVMAVFASHGYDDADYIRNYDEFLAYKKR